MTKINSTQENIEKAVIFLKSLKPYKFYSFGEIDKTFKLGKNYSYKNLRNYFKIVKNEIITIDNNRYYSIKGLSNNLDIEYSRIRHIIAETKPLFIRVYFKSNKKLSIKKFFLLKNIIDKLPSKYRNYYKIISHDKIPLHIINSRPNDLNNKQFLIFCCLIIFYKNNNYWPSKKLLRSYIFENYHINMDISQIYKAIGKLNDLKYLKEIRINKYYSIYYIFKGPFDLNNKLIKCVDPFSQKTYLMYAPYDFYKPL